MPNQIRCIFGLVYISFVSTNTILARYIPIQVGYMQYVLLFFCLVILICYAAMHGLLRKDCPCANTQNNSY